jgi:hypothetical protein
MTYTHSVKTIMMETTITEFFAIQQSKIKFVIIKVCVINSLISGRSNNRHAHQSLRPKYEYLCGINFSGSFFLSHTLLMKMTTYKFPYIIRAD